MRDDIAKLLCEKPRSRSGEKSLKTALKMNPNCDFESDDFDGGPNYVSSARHRQESRCSVLRKSNGKTQYKQLNENLNPLYRFLDKSVGRKWDDVYSEIRENINFRKAVHLHVLQHLETHVDVNGTGIPSWRYGDGLYVDEDGVLSRWVKTRPVRPKAPIDSLHWHDNVWFKRETFKTEAKCGCVHFKVPPQVKEPRYRWRYSKEEPAVCIHGNEPVPRPIWFVVEYFYHSPDEVRDTYRLEDYREKDGSLRRGYEYYGLSEDRPVIQTYYRDFPKLLAEPISKLTKKKTANRKDLKLIREALEAAGQKAA